MTVSQSALAWLYLYATLLGIALGGFYDLFRITRVFLGMHYSRRTANRLRELHLPLLRKRRRRGESRALGIVIFFEDLLFCMVTGISLVILFYEVNSGRFRFPALLCAGAGFLLYRGTIGRLVMLFSEVIAFVIETGVRYLVFFLLYPLRIGAKWLKHRADALRLYLLQRHRHTLRRRYTAGQAERVTRDACGLLSVALKDQSFKREHPKNKQERHKKGKLIHNGKQEETIHTVASDAHPSRRSDRRFDRNICK